MSICGFCRLHGSLVARSLKRHRWGNQLHRNRYKQPEPPYAHKKLCCAAAAVQEALPSTSAANGRQAKPAFRVNLDWKYVKDNVEALKANAASRNSAANPALVAQLYDEWREQENEAEELRTQRNANAKKMKSKLSAEERQTLIQEGQALKERLATLEEAAEAAQDALQREGQRLPNLTHPEVPLGGEEMATVLKLVGRRPSFSFQVKDHLALGEALDVIDFETGAKASGTKFVYLKRAAALLEMALCNYALQKATSRGYVPVTTPDLVREAILEKCGFQPRAENTQVYSIENSTLCLTGTAEVPLGAMYADTVLSEEQLPIRLAAFGHCFRTEAGAAGSASRGLYRVHQFSKVEMFVLCTPAQSEALLDELCGIEEEIFGELGLHFRILDMPSTDLGAPAYRKLDIEAWMPGLERFGEISSASNCTDYQSRRLEIRYRPLPPPAEQNGAKATQKPPKRSPTQYVHTLNATACAVPRLIVAILENFQQEDGTVRVPEVLQPFMGGLKLITPPPQ